MNLHARHSFTHAVATDGSLKAGEDGSVRVAVGLWEGVAPFERASMAESAGRRYDRTGRETDEDVLRRIGRGMWGAAVPSASMNTIVDAEMYAVLLYLRRMVGDGGTNARERRCLVLSDCQPALKAIETAWRKGRLESGRGGDRGPVQV